MNYFVQFLIFVGTIAFIVYLFKCARKSKQGTKPNGHFTLLEKTRQPDSGGDRKAYIQEIETIKEMDEVFEHIINATPVKHYRKGVLLCRG